MHYILRLDLKSRRIVNLFEITSEVALMIVLPFDQAADIVSEFRVAHVAPCLVHRALVAALQSRCLEIVPQTAPLITCLVLDLGTHDIQDERIARYLLVRLDLDDVTRLDAAPVRDLKALVPL